MSSSNGNDDMNTLTEEEEQELLRILQTSLRSLPDMKDPTKELAPASVIEGALWVHDWHNMDAELARLASESQATPELAGVRAASPPLSRKFVTEDYEIGIDIEPGEAGATLTGTLWPIVDGTVEIVVGGVARRATIDHLGGFVLDNVDHGTVLAVLKTTSGTIRLEPFEI